MSEGHREWHFLFNRAMDVELGPTFVDMVCFLNTYQWSHCLIELLALGIGILLVIFLLGLIINFLIMVVYR